MRYNNYVISKNEQGKYIITDVFNNHQTKHTYKSVKEAKGVIDNILSKKDNSLKRYMPVHYSQYWWRVIDKRTNLYVKDAEGKFLSFKRREECFDWCDNHNNLI